MGDHQNNEDLIEEESLFVSKLWNILPVFVNTLDIKTFVNLAMTNMEIYERCMKDRMIRLKVEEKILVVSSNNSHCDPRFIFHSHFVKNGNPENYLQKLRQLRCNVSLESVVISGVKMDADTIKETRRYLDEIKVKNITNLKISVHTVAGWPQIVSFIKDFKVKDIEYCCDVPEDILRSSLQWNLNSLSYDREVQGELLLEVESPIPQLKFSHIEASAHVFSQILWKIQTGALKSLSTGSRDFPWGSYTNVECDYDEPLPEERPLLIIGNMKKWWFLHWNGGVTKCVRNDGLVEFSKCEKDELPVVLQPKEDVHKALAEKSRMMCIKSHFTSFFDGIPVLDAYHEGAFPEERPLLCKADEQDFEDLEYYLLNEDASIDVYRWERCAHYEGHYDLDKGEWPEAYRHFALLKFLVKNRIEKYKKDGSFECWNSYQFRSLFAVYEPLSHDFRGQLPERRPLVFESPGLQENDNDYHYEEEEDYRIVLYDDGTVVQFKYDNSTYMVTIHPCPASNLPRVLSP